MVGDTSIKCMQIYYYNKNKYDNRHLENNKRTRFVFVNFIQPYIIAADSYTPTWVIKRAYTYVQGLCKTVYFFFVPEIFPSGHRDDNKATDFSKTIIRNYTFLARAISVLVKIPNPTRNVYCIILLLLIIFFFFF